MAKKPDSDVARTVVFRTRLTPWERDRVNLAAERSQVNLSAKVREYILRWTRKVLGDE